MIKAFILFTVAGLLLTNVVCKDIINVFAESGEILDDDLVVNVAITNNNDVEIAETEDDR